MWEYPSGLVTAHPGVPKQSAELEPRSLTCFGSSCALERQNPMRSCLKCPEPQSPYLERLQTLDNCKLPIQSSSGLLQVNLKI